MYLAITFRNILFLTIRGAATFSKNTEKTDAFHKVDK